MPSQVILPDCCDPDVYVQQRRRPILGIPPEPFLRPSLVMGPAVLIRPAYRRAPTGFATVSRDPGGEYQHFIHPRAWGRAIVGHGSRLPFQITDKRMAGGTPAPRGGRGSKRDRPGPSGWKGRGGCLGIPAMTDF